MPKTFNEAVDIIRAKYRSALQDIEANRNAGKDSKELQCYANAYLDALYILDTVECLCKDCEEKQKEMHNIATTAHNYSQNDLPHFLGKNIKIDLIYDNGFSKTATGVLVKCADNVFEVVGETEIVVFRTEDVVSFNVIPRHLPVHRKDTLAECKVAPKDGRNINPNRFLEIVLMDEDKDVVYIDLKDVECIKLEHYETFDDIIFYSRQGKLNYRVNDKQEAEKLFAIYISMWMLARE